jgi:1-deoxy-D-xylulose-5-phosphate reductoisomerase
MTSARKRVTILGATGSVGQSTLDLIQRAPDAFEVVALTAQNDVEGLAKAARATNAKLAVIGKAEHYDALKAALAGTGTEAAAGEAAIIDAARRDTDWTMAAIVGCAGLMPVMAALEQGRSLAFANKEARRCFPWIQSIMRFSNALINPRPKASRRSS